MVFGKVLVGCSLAPAIPAPAVVAQPAVQEILVLARVAVLVALVLVVAELAEVRAVHPGARLVLARLVREALAGVPAALSEEILELPAPAVCPVVRARDLLGSVLALVVVAREVAQLRAGGVAPVGLVPEVAQSLVAPVAAAARPAPEAAGARPVELRVELALLVEAQVVAQQEAVAVQVAEVPQVAQPDQALFRVQAELLALLAPIPL